jgi:hypothetical protein
VPPELLPRLRVHVIDLHGGRSVHFSPVASPRGRAPEISDDEAGFRIGQLPRGADSRKLDRQLPSVLTPRFLVLFAPRCHFEPRPYWLVGGGFAGPSGTYPR